MTQELKDAAVKFLAEDNNGYTNIKWYISPLNHNDCLMFVAKYITSYTLERLQMEIPELKYYNVSTYVAARSEWEQPEKGELEIEVTYFFRWKE